ncbi:hypothetical protein WJ969_03365 [Achromobacter xylosoxidans]
MAGGGCRRGATGAGWACGAGVPAARVAVGVAARRGFLRVPLRIIESAVDGGQHFDAAIHATVRHDQRVGSEHLAHLAHHVPAVGSKKRLIFIAHYLRR